MANYAKVALTGKIVSEPKKRDYNGTTVINFRMSVYTTKKVDDKYVFDYYNVNFWGKAAEGVFSRLKQDVRVQVYGDQYQEEYTGQNGEKRLGVSVRASDVICIEPKEAAKKTKVAVEEEEDLF